MESFKNIKEDRFCEIKDYFPEIEYLLENNLCFLAGGSLRTLVDREDVLKDIDLFFKEQENIEKVKEYLTQEGYNQVFACPKGELFTYKQGDFKIQLICKRLYTDLYDLVGSFDIVASCVGWDGKELISHTDWVKDVKKKQITFNVVTYPVATISRVYKYLKKRIPLYTNKFARFSCPNK